MLQKNWKKAPFPRKKKSTLNYLIVQQTWNFLIIYYLIKSWP